MRSHTVQVYMTGHIRDARSPVLTAAQSFPPLLSNGLFLLPDSPLLSSLAFPFFLLCHCVVTLRCVPLRADSRCLLDTLSSPPPPAPRVSFEASHLSCVSAIDWFVGGGTGWKEEVTDERRHVRVALGRLAWLARPLKTRRLSSRLVLAGFGFLIVESSSAASTSASFRLVSPRLASPLSAPCLVNQSRPALRCIPRCDASSQAALESLVFSASVQHNAFRRAVSIK